MHRSALSVVDSGLFATDPKNAKDVRGAVISCFLPGWMEGKAMYPNKGFIMYKRGYDMSIHRKPEAWNLLCIIAQRAKRTDSFENRELTYGEALVGDYQNYGLTQRKYRTAKHWLEAHEIATFRTTNKGTIARIVDTSIFDINVNESTSQTSDRRQADDEQTTTNKNDKNENNEKETTAVEKIRRTLGDKYLYKDGKHYFLKGETWQQISNPKAFADSLKEPETPLSFNPILRDSLFRNLMECPDRTSDAWIRKSPTLFRKLEEKYPAWKHPEWWAEVRRQLQ